MFVQFEVECWYYIYIFLSKKQCVANCKLFSDKHCNYELFIFLHLKLLFPILNTIIKYIVSWIKALSTKWGSYILILCFDFCKTLLFEEAHWYNKQIHQVWRNQNVGNIADNKFVQLSWFLLHLIVGKTIMATNYTPLRIDLFFVLVKHKSYINLS